MGGREGQAQLFLSETALRADWVPKSGMSPAFFEMTSSDATS